MSVGHPDPKRGGPSPLQPLRRTKHDVSQNVRPKRAWNAFKELNGQGHFGRSTQVMSVAGGIGKVRAPG